MKELVKELVKSNRHVEVPKKCVCVDISIIYLLIFKIKNIETLDN